MAAPSVVVAAAATRANAMSPIFASCLVWVRDWLRSPHGGIACVASPGTTRVLMAACALLCCIGDAQAQEEDRAVGAGEGVVRSAVYADSDSTLVTTNIVDADVTVADGVSVGAHALIDRVSSASVDVVTAATGRFFETRLEAGIRGDVALPSKVDLDVAYSSSRENDWQSHSVQLGLAKRMAQDNAVFSIAYGGVTNRVGRSGDSVFEESQVAHTGQVAISQLIDPTSVVSLSYFAQHIGGYQSSPYRFASTMDGALTVPEAHPERRLRQALSAEYRRYLARYAALTARYRLYIDDWGVLSHTGRAQLRVIPADRWAVEVGGRGYTQRGAGFYQQHYSQVQRYMSNDRELSTFWDVSVGGKLEWRRGALTVRANVEGIYYRFLEFASLGRRYAVVSSGGVGYQW